MHENASNNANYQRSCFAILVIQKSNWISLDPIRHIMSHSHYIYSTSHCTCTKRCDSTVHMFKCIMYASKFAEIGWSSTSAMHAADKYYKRIATCMNLPLPIYIWIFHCQWKHIPGFTSENCDATVTAPTYAWCIYLSIDVLACNRNGGHSFARSRGFHRPFPC